MNPGDSLEGHGQLLRHGQLIAQVEYHLTIPREIYFAVNPTGGFNPDYEAHLGGFILLNPADAAKISLIDYTLELADKSKKAIHVERRYKEVKYQGHVRVSFWVKVI